MKKLQNFIHKIKNNYFFQLLVITLTLIVAVFKILESTDTDIAFIYNNF